MYEDRTQNYDSEIREEYLVNDTPFCHIMTHRQTWRKVNFTGHGKNRHEVDLRASWTMEK